MPHRSPRAMKGLYPLVSSSRAAAGAAALRAVAPPPTRVTDSSTLKFSSRSLAATRLAVSASRNAPTCTQNGPLETAVDGVALAAARFGAAGVVAAADVAAAAGLASSLVALDGFALLSAFAIVSGFGADAGGAGTSGFALSVTAIALLLLASLGGATARASLRGGVGLVSTARAVGGGGLLSLFGSEREGGGAGAGVEGVMGAGMSVVSLFSVADAGFSAGDAGLSGVVGKGFAATGGRETGGFIQSSTHGTATAPTTPRTITTRTTRNQVAAKIDRGGTSSYRSCSSLGSSCCGLTATS